LEGWGKIIAGFALGVAGTVYATNEELRRQLPKSARELPENLRRRFMSAVSAAREASSKRREEILRDLAEHDAAHTARGPYLEPVGVDPTPAANERQESPEEGSR
jgi:uncharacterized membrane protein YccC